MTEHELTVGSLFSGIGGLDLGLERAGMRVKWQCEIDPYCRAVLGHHWPGLPLYEDIRDIDETAERVDLICGGFPCQPVSLAGKGLAQEDPRWLWPEFARVVGLLRPRYVVVENVPGLVKRGLGDVITGLEEMGYDAEWEIVSAAACGAPHLRERIFVVANSNRLDDKSRPGNAGVREEDHRLGEHDHSRGSSEGGGSREAAVHPDSDSQRFSQRSERDGQEAQPGEQASFGDDFGGLRSDVADTNGSSGNRPWPAGEAVFRPEAVERLRRRSSGNGEHWAVEPTVGRVAHGIPNRLARLRALGNAVVPQVAEAVGRMILEAHCGV